MKNTFLAFELGTTEGRTLLGELNDGILSLQEIHRFVNEPVMDEDHKYWNIELLFKEIKKSLVLVADQNIPVESIGITAWSVDFSIMGDDGAPFRPLLSDDVKTEISFDGFTQRISEDKIYGQTGIPVPCNSSLFRLSASKKTAGEELKKAKHLLFMPDIFNYLLTGIMSTEFSIAITSQLYNPVKRMWDHEIFKALGIPVSIMSRIVEPGSIIGSVSTNVSYETGIARIPVVAVVSNDVASAIAAIPAKGNNWIYISAGSKFLIGFESNRPIINKKSQQLNFTNQGGVGHAFHIQQSLTGLQLLQECLNAWGEDGYTSAFIQDLAGTSKSFTAFMDTDHASLFNQDDMPTAILEYCKATGQYAPQSHGEIMRIILEGFALKFRIVIGQIEELSGVKPEAIYLTGEAINNELLCQFTADCCGIPVITSPDETVTTGNILVQAMALGIIKNVDEIREIAGKSFPPRTYQPSETSVWDEAFKQYLQIVNPE